MGKVLNLRQCLALRTCICELEQSKVFLGPSPASADSYYYPAMEGHAKCLITWKVMKQLGYQSIVQLWVPKEK